MIGLPEIILVIIGLLIVVLFGRKFLRKAIQQAKGVKEDLKEFGSENKPTQNNIQ